MGKIIKVSYKDWQRCIFERNIYSVFHLKTNFTQRNDANDLLTLSLVSIIIYFFRKKSIIVHI